MFLRNFEMANSQQQDQTDARSHNSESAVGAFIVSRISTGQAAHYWKPLSSMHNAQAWDKRENYCRRFYMKTFTTSSLS